MPTTLPDQPPSLGAGIASRRRPYGLFRTAAMLALLLLGRMLFAAAMKIADFADSFVRRD